MRDIQSCRCRKKCLKKVFSHSTLIDEAQFSNTAIAILRGYSSGPARQVGHGDLYTRG